MVGTRKEPKAVKSYAYKKILFDKRSESFYATEEQLKNYRENVVNGIILAHQAGVTTLKHELELAELVSISYYCWFGRQPTCRVGNNGKFPRVFKKYHARYNEAWLAVVMRLINSFKVGKGSWHSYVMFAKRDGLRTTKMLCDREAREAEGFKEYKEHMRSVYYLNQNKQHTSFIISDQY